MCRENDALLATTMKPLNALPRFENHFAIETVRFQVQLEADGYFSVQEIFAFAIVASRASWYQLAIFWIWFYKSDFKNDCWASPKPDVPHKIALATRFRWYRISKFSWRKIRFEKISVDSFNIASNRNYYFRFWRQKVEVMLPKNLSDFMVCSF